MASHHVKLFIPMKQLTTRLYKPILGIVSVYQTISDSPNLRLVISIGVK